MSSNLLKIESSGENFLCKNKNEDKRLEFFLIFSRLSKNKIILRTFYYLLRKGQNHCITVLIVMKYRN
jgi:hypothetical protein